MSAVASARAAQGADETSAFEGGFVDIDARNSVAVAVKSSLEHNLICPAANGGPFIQGTLRFQQVSLFVDHVVGVEADVLHQLCVEFFFTLVGHLIGEVGEFFGGVDEHVGLAVDIVGRRLFHFAVPNFGNVGECADTAGRFGRAARFCFIPAIEYVADIVAARGNRHAAGTYGTARAYATGALCFFSNPSVVVACVAVGTVIVIAFIGDVDSIAHVFVSATSEFKCCFNSCLLGAGATGFAEDGACRRRFAAVVATGGEEGKAAKGEEACNAQDLVRFHVVSVFEKIYCGVRLVQGCNSNKKVWNRRCPKQLR